MGDKPGYSTEGAVRQRNKQDREMGADRTSKHTTGCDVTRSNDCPQVGVNCFDGRGQVHPPVEIPSLPFDLFSLCSIE